MEKYHNSKLSRDNSVNKYIFLPYVQIWKIPCSFPSCCSRKPHISLCIFEISANFCCNCILVKVNMSLPMSNSNYPAEQISLVCCKERKVKEGENVRLSAAPAFPLKDFPLKRTESLMRGLFPHYLLLDSKKFLLTSNSNSFYTDRPV